jgi:hypothetical protein
MARVHGPQPHPGTCDKPAAKTPIAPSCPSAGGTAVATGDVQVTNTGNIGTIVRMKITWPQQVTPRWP